MFRNYAKDEIKAIQLETGVKTVFSQNAKMRKSSQNGIHLYNWGIPAYKSQNGTLTCPNASKCIAGCYAKSGAYVWSNVAQAYENRLSLSRTKGFEQVITYHIDQLILKHITKPANALYKKSIATLPPENLILIRIHDSGDFYSESYFEAWCNIIRQYENLKSIQFYAYTKMVQFCKSYTNSPTNLKLIYSFGGREDSHIDTEHDRHSFVFQNETELAAMGYSDASHDDTIAALGSNNKIGLVYHGVKSYSNTTWNKVVSK